MLNRLTWLSSLSTSVIVQTYALCSIKAASTSMTTKATNVSADGISLWKGAAPTSWEQFDYIQTDKTLAATIQNVMGAT